MTSADVARPRGPEGTPRHSLRDAVVAEIRRRVIAGEIGPGERIGEAALAAELGVSRVPVREAFRALESEGMLESTPRRGVRVVGTDTSEAAAVEEIRLALELLAVRLATERCDTTMSSAFDTFLREGDAAIASNDLATLAELNRRFHQLLADGTGSPLLVRLLETVRTRSDQLRPPTNDRRIYSSWRDHSEIVRHVLAGNLPAAEARMEAHLVSHRVPART